MKIWSRDFTRREKLTLFGLLILLIAILYFQCVDRPVRTSINAARAEAQEIETEMSIVAAKVRQLTKMQNELLPAHLDLQQNIINIRCRLHPLHIRHFIIRNQPFTFVSIQLNMFLRKLV